MSLFLSPDFPHDDDDDRAMLLSGRAAPGTHDSFPAPSLELNNLQPSSETRSSEKVTGDVEALRIALFQLKNDLEAEIERKKKEELETDARNRRLRSRWFPWLAVALMTNLLLWLSMLFLIFRVQEYITHRTRYIVTGWTVFMIPLLVFSFFLLSPYPPELRRQRTEVAAKRHTTNYLSTVNIANASCCFTLVVIYLYASALPQYNAPKWEAGVDFLKDLSLPAFSFTIPSISFEPVDPAQFDVDTFGCNEAVKESGLQSCPESAFAGTPLKLNLDSATKLFGTGSSLAYVYNSTELSPNTNTSNLAEVFLVATVNCKDLVSGQEQIADLLTDSSYDHWFGSPPFLEVAIFDPRINLTDAINCDLVQLVQIPHAATNTFYLTAELITDTLGMIVPPATERCVALYKEALSRKASPYMSFGISLSTESGGNSSICESDACVSTAIFSYASHVVHTMESKPGIDQLTIWLNCGAIVGAVQFFAWFLGIFSL